MESEIDDLRKLVQSLKEEIDRLKVQKMSLENMIISLQEDIENLSRKR